MMTKLHRTLNARLDKAVWEYKMLQDNDGVLFAVSGGADSMALLDLFHFRFDVYGKNIKFHAVYVDLGFGDAASERCRTMQHYFDEKNVTSKIIETDIGPYAHSEKNRENPCFLCTRIRRKKIFETAEEFGCNKIVFGHHKDDITETLLLNMIMNREISTMPPMLEVFQGKYSILRPFVFVEEDLIKKYVYERNLPSFDQLCPTDGHSKRQYIKTLLSQLETDYKGAKENIFASMKRVKTDYLL